MNEPLRRNELPKDINNSTPTEGQSMYVRPVRQAKFHTPSLGRGSYFREDNETNLDPFSGMTEYWKEQKT